MYFGRTDAFATEIFVYELVSNVLDRYLSGTATFVGVEIDEDRITVVDDGPGLPFDLPSDCAGVTLATGFLTMLHFYGSRDGHIPHVHAGYLSWCGVSCFKCC
jgi:DNA gyrase subunit B